MRSPREPTQPRKLTDSPLLKLTLTLLLQVQGAALPKTQKKQQAGACCFGVMVRPERFELPTAWFVARYSIQLSYGRIRQKRNYAEPASLRQSLPARIFAYGVVGEVHRA